MSSSPTTGQHPAGIAGDTGISVSRAEIDERLKAILVQVLAIDEAQAGAMGPQSGLFGHLPELDSMAVAGLLTEVEDRFDIVIEDDEVDGEMLETYGALLAFIEAKLAGK